MVEDDEDLRDVVVRALRNDTVQVIEAEDGVAALEVIDSQGLPDLILLDMNMPVMNGWELARVLRERGLWHVPVIVITAAHDAARSAHDIGATAYLGKPFDLATLHSVVASALPKVSAHV
ncbi:MAG: response regulator [Kofleriaceae bacterium]|nr:response regulator [Kofleriaceae bacterium]